MDGHGISLSRTVWNKALLHPCVPYLLSLTCYGTPFCSPKMSKFYQDFPCLAKCCLAFFGGDAKSLAWVFLARRVLPFVFGFYFGLFCGRPNPSLGCFLLVGCCLSCLGSFVAFLGAMPNPSLGCFLHVGCCLSCLGSFVAFFGGDAKSLAWVFLARRVLTKWMVMGSVYLELFETKPCCILCALLSLTCYGTPFCSPKMSKIRQDFPCLAKCCLAFFGGDAKSLAWVFLARRVLPFRVCFFLPFLGAMPNPSLGCFLLVRCCLSCWGSFVAFFGGDAKSLAWVFLARRVLPFVFGFNMIGYTAIWNNRSWTKIASLRYPAMPPPV